MSYAARIIDRFGGTRPAATRLGKPASTVQSWKDSGVIPTRAQAEVLAAGRELDPPLEPADFFPPEPDASQAAAE